MDKVTYVEVSDMEWELTIGRPCYESWMTASQRYPTQRWFEQKGESLFWSLAGPMAVPLKRDGQLWERQPHNDSYRTYFTISKTPEGLLL